MSEFVISRDENIGIFWMVDGMVFGERTTISEASQSVDGLMDSDATHVASWSKHYQFRDRNPELAHYDYQDLPRGRVLYQMNKQRFLVYLDKALMNKKTKPPLLNTLVLQCKGPIGKVTCTTRPTLRHWLNYSKIKQ